MKITISKTDKFTFPNVFESSGTGLSAEFEIDQSLPLEQQQAQVMECKAMFEQLYWPLANFDVQTFLQRLQMGSQPFVSFKAQQ